MTLPLLGSNIPPNSLSTKNAQKVNIDNQGESGFDKSVEYSYPFNLNGQKLCLFNGDDYGKSGLGIGVISY
jgi:hypothetical protein